MKKRVLSVLLMLMLCVSSLPSAVCAAPVMLNHVDITIELPNGGDLFDPGYIPTLTSCTSNGIDLLATGASILKADWVGDTPLNDNGYPLFKGGTTYQVSIKLLFNSAAGYCANYVMSNGEYLAGPDTFSATVNGIPATVSRNQAPYAPTVEVSLTLDGEAISAEEKAAISAEDALHTQMRRDSKTPRTYEESVPLYVENYPEKIVVLDCVDDFGYNGGLDAQQNAVREKDVTTVIVDTDYAVPALYSTPYSSSIKEIWVGNDVDILKLYRTIYENSDYTNRCYCPLNRSDGKLFVSEAAANTLLAKLGTGYYPAPAFTIKVYSGTDVHAAQKAGATAARDFSDEFCINHRYDTLIPSPDRIYTFGTCKVGTVDYYSCGICGKCEYNPNHVAWDTNLNPNASYEDFNPSNKQYNTELPRDSAYIGVNAAGQHVWWLSCNACDVSYKEDQLNATDADKIGTGMEQMSFAEFKATLLASLKQREEQILNSTTTQPGTFTLGRKSNANISGWAQADVNLALNDNLLDTALLGNDYTQNISRLQFCSVAVKLAEELTGKSITPAAASTFTDTTDAYALKAYAAGITSGVSATEFDPNGTLTRQQMATFIYRALRYIEQNSDYSYTNYTSKLDSYADRAQIQGWAEEAMAFMNALDLVKGNTDTTLNPNGICTIEQAVAVADRSVYAHQLGWYQVDPEKYAVDQYGTKWGDNYTYIRANCRYGSGDYLWVTGRRLNLNYITDISGKHTEEGTLPFVNTYTGQILEVDYKDVVPVRN